VQNFGWSKWQNLGWSIFFKNFFCVKQPAGGPVSPLVDAIGNLLRNIIKIVKDLLNQLLPTLNDLVQDVDSLKILPNFLFSSNWTM
jgi:hypothetical protein